MKIIQKKSAKFKFHHQLFLFVLVSLMNIQLIPAADVVASQLPEVPKITFGDGSPSQAGNVLTVQQTSPKMIVEWNSFNIGSQATVNFNNGVLSAAGKFTEIPCATCAVLNRVNSSGGMSQIYGNLNANQQVYLINPNGILFGPGSQVNVNSLVASSLRLDNSLFINGLLSIKDGRAAFGGEGDASNGLVQVLKDPTGKLKDPLLQAESGGRIMMFAPKAVTNEGVIKTPDGQTLLAAGEKIYLTSSEESNLRGLLVEIDAGGTVQNLGQIITERGNATLAGIAVRQDGRINATTSVSLNGSIKLQAKDTTDTKFITPTQKQRFSTHAGSVVLGKDSITSVLPDMDDKSTSVDSGIFVQSSVDIFGSTIHLQENAWIVAPSGNVSLVSGLNPAIHTISSKNLGDENSSRIYFDAKSSIDVSGLGSQSIYQEVLKLRAESKAVNSNIVQAELRGAELADSPLQRNGILYTSKVYVDSRKTSVDGSPGTSVADVTGYLLQIGRTVSERSATGGTVKVESEGDIIFSPSASVNVSGGLINYTGGLVTSTFLIGANGKSYDISIAPKDMAYVEILNKKNYEAGYVDGKNAGSVSFSAPSMLLLGTLDGASSAGLYQRDAHTYPSGGTLKIGQNIAFDGPLSESNILRSDVELNSSSIQIYPDFDTRLTQVQKQKLVLGKNFSSPLGFSHLQYFADGQITVSPGTNVEVMPLGSIVMNGGGINIGGDLVSHGGSILLEAKFRPAYNGFKLGYDMTTNDVVLNNFVKLDVSGSWINNYLNAESNSPIVIDGGSISIKASSQTRTYGGNVLIGDNSLLNASGGGWINSAKTLKSGAGGKINLFASGGFGDGSNHIGKLTLPQGSLRADSLSVGGSLNLTSGSVTIGVNESNTNGELLLTPGFFQEGGFTSFNINSFEALTVKDVYIAPASKTRVLNRDFIVHSTGEDIATFSSMQLFADRGQNYKRIPTNLSLNATTETFGVLTIGDGSVINMDMGAVLNLSAQRQLSVLGSIIAPSGKVSLTLGHNPYAKEVLHYLNPQSIWFGPKSLIDVSAVADVYTNYLGFLSGSIPDAGSIKIDALKGAVVGVKGSSLKLNGTHSQLDLNANVAYQRKDIGSRGGSLYVSAREGIFLDNNIEAHAGNDSVMGGSFALDISKDFDIANDTNLEFDSSYPMGIRQIYVLDSSLTTSNGLGNISSPINTTLNGKAYFYADKINNAGFDSVSLTSRDNIKFIQNTLLNINGSIILDTPNLIVDNGVAARLDSAYVGIGNGSSLRQQAYERKSLNNKWEETGYVRDVLSGTGSFDVSAKYIDLFGNQSISASKGALFHSNGDIQLQGVLAKNDPNLIPKGMISAAGDLKFDAARIYPSSLSEYTIKTSGAAATINFSRVDHDTGVPYSALGTLNVLADNIYQGGVLRAPLGVINLNANVELTLASGSLTSVSAEGKTLPFGVTSNGNNWLFDFGDSTRTIGTLPDKSINLIGNSIKVESENKNNGLGAAKIDISGGGDLKAWEFTIGTGGSQDVLDSNGVFAVMPGLSNTYMPGNSMSYGDLTIKPGNMVYLSGGNGLVAGNYVLLPAHYALLAGAYSVKAVAGTQDMLAQQNILNLDGSMLVSGYKMQYGGLVADARTSGFLVSSGTIARTQSEFSTTLASDFFKASYKDANITGYRLPDDAGRFAISAVSNLVLSGNMQMIAAGSGRGAEVDISAAKIAISGNERMGSIGYLTLSDKMLNAMGAESLLIGGKRSSVASGTKLDVMASNVELIGKANLSGQEIILAATGKVATETETTISGSGTTSTNSSALIIGSSTAGSGDGAVLRVSSGVQRELNRLSVAKSKGTLDLQGFIKNAKSVILDATNSSTLSGTVAMDSGGSLSVGAPIISFGETTKSVGLLFNASRLSALGSPSNLLLNSYSTLDFYGAVTLGGERLDNLSMRSAGINGYDNASKEVTLNAKTIIFANTGDLDFSSLPSTVAGTFVMNAKEIISGENTFKTAGFGKVAMNADQFNGKGVGALDVAGDLNINAKRITSASLSDQTIKASGTLQTSSQPAFPEGVSFTGESPSALKAAFGGKLTLTAETINHAGNIEMPAGIVTLKATGTGDSLTLKAGSSISTKGSAEQLGTVAVLVDAGQVNLLTTNGNISMESKASIDVSASEGPAAGFLGVSSAGTANLLGSLNGGAVPGNDVINPTQGSFEYYASNFPNIDAFNNLNVELEKGNFNEIRNIHVSLGDLTVDNTVTAHKLTLSTDNGNINVTGNGKIDASGAKGGIVNLNAGQKSGSGKGNINLASGATIDASSTTSATENAGSTGDGGKVTINTSANSDTYLGTGSSIVLNVGSKINLSKGVDSSGGGLGSDGTLVLRVPRSGISSPSDVGNDVAITVTNLSEIVKGDNAKILIEAVKTYDKHSNDVLINSTFAEVLYNDNSQFLNASSGIASRLSNYSDPRIHLIAGIEIKTAASITVEDIDLQILNSSELLDNGFYFTEPKTWGAGALTLRAGNNINIKGNISSGFAIPLDTDGYPTLLDENGKGVAVLSPGGIWSYRLVSGSQLDSADVMSTNDLKSGNFTLYDGKLIRTGTGDIQIATANNIKFGKNSSIYTTGEADITNYSDLGSFISPNTSYPAIFTDHGGDISVSSKGEISSFKVDQLPSNWLFRQGTLEGEMAFKNTAWWPSFLYFKQNIGALGGGDVNVFASKGINDLSAAIATNARLLDSSHKSSTLLMNGGGDMNIHSNKDILGGFFMVDKGALNISAVGGVKGGTESNYGNYSMAIALGDAKVKIVTNNELNISAVINPTMIGFSKFNAVNSDSIQDADKSFFSTYGKNSSVSLNSIASNVFVNLAKATDLYDGTKLQGNSIASAELTLFPGILDIKSLGGDISVSGQLRMIPSDQASLKMSATGSINFRGLNAGILMSDIGPDLIPSSNTPSLYLDFINDITGYSQVGYQFHGASLIRSENSPVAIYAGKNISGEASSPYPTLVLPKRATITAGNDIVNFWYQGQNLYHSDTTTISAGHDIYFTSPIQDGAYLKNQNAISLGGPGNLLISAGRNINLGNSDGIITIGNKVNPYLPEAGAGINLLLSSATSDKDAVITKYLNPLNTIYLEELRSFVKNQIGYKDSAGTQDLTNDQVFGYFKNFEDSTKYLFAQTILFNELKMAGVEHNDPSSPDYGNYKRGYEAANVMFPKDEYSGSLNVSFSQIRTEAGGGLNVVNPGGNVLVGLPKTPASILATKNDATTSYDDSPSVLGLFTVKGGSINIFSRDSVEVAKSRVFTVAGGDVLIWSTLGNIDAGKGAKTATSAPPPLIRTDIQGNTVVDLSGVVSGSGIGTLQTLKDAPLGNVYLIAPSGTVDAGDAGVRSSGNLLVAAQAVANGANMQAGGTSSGVPAPSTANVSFNAPVSSDSSNSSKQADKATEAASKSASKTASALPSLITVEVLALGDDAASSSDLEKDEKKKAKKQ